MSSTDGPDADAEAADHLGPLPMPGAVPATRHAAASEPRPSIGASTTSLGSTTSDGRRRFSIEANSMNQVASFGPDMHSRSAASIAGSAANIRVLAGGDCGDAGSGGASSGNGGTTKPPAPTPHLVRLAGGGYAHAATVASTHVQGAGAAASASATAGDAGIGAAHGASTHLQAARTDIADIRSPERRQDPAQRMPLNPSVPATANADRARARAPSMSMVPSFQHVSAASDGRLSALDRLRQSPVAVKITDVMASPVYIVLVMLTSVWAIVSYDVRVLWASPDADDSFVVVTLLLVALFVVEVAAYSLLVRGYFLSFFFWIDILATVSLLPDVLATTWTREPSDDVHDSVLEDSLRDNLRVSPAARMLRVMRVMRASRVGLVGVSLGQALSSWREGHTSKQEASLMGRTLVYHTHVIVIAGIVVLLLGTSTLESAAADDDGAAREGLRMLHVAAPAMLALGTAGAGNWTSLVDTYVSNVQGIAASDRGASFGVLHLSVRGEVLVDWSARGGAAESGLRVVGPAEVLAVSCNDATASPLSPLPPFTSLAAGTTGLEGDGPDVSRVVLSIRGSVEAHAATDLAQCTLVLAVLTVWLLLCSAEFHRLVLIPLERMLSLLQQMMRDPLAAVDMSHGATAVSGSGLSRASARSHEMAVVEASLAKFGKLLQLGFGDAGARIIARSLNQGKLDVMAPGNKVVAALAFCDIRSFTECCECLRQHVLTFTNAVGHEVSQAVHGNGGCVNKNIGGECARAGPLLVYWRLLCSCCCVCAVVRLRCLSCCAPRHSVPCSRARCPGSAVVVTRVHLVP